MVSCTVLLDRKSVDQLENASFVRSLDAREAETSKDSGTPEAALVRVPGSDFPPVELVADVVVCENFRALLAVSGTQVHVYLFEK